MSRIGPRVALALGAGGARGYAHIGVIVELEERGFEVVGVAGTSMGALVGGLHAAGRLGAYTEWVVGLTQRDVLRLLDPTLRAPGVIRAERVMDRVRGMVEGVLIEDLPITYTAVATDLLAGSEVWFQQGPLDTAIRASIALPSVITPVTVDGRLLADGGLLNPVPIAPLTPVRADVVVAVSLAGTRRGVIGRSSTHPMPQDRPGEERLQLLRRAAQQLRDQDVVRALTERLSGITGHGVADAEAAEADQASAGLPPGLRTLDVVTLSLEAMQSLILRYRLSSYPPDVLIEVPVDACGALEFHRANELIALGRERARAALDSLE